MTMYTANDEHLLALLPAAFISMIGVDETQQGNGIGSALVADALCRIARVSDEIGTCVIVLDVFDDGDAETVARRKAYYKAFGFLPIPDQPLRLFMPVQTARELLSSLVFAGFGSCGDLAGFGSFNSVSERNAFDDFGEVVKAA